MCLADWSGPSSSTQAGSFSDWFVILVSAFVSWLLVYDIGNPI